MIRLYFQIADGSEVFARCGEFRFYECDQYEKEHLEVNVSDDVDGALRVTAPSGVYTVMVSDLQKTKDRIVSEDSAYEVDIRDFCLTE